MRSRYPTALSVLLVLAGSAALAQTMPTPSNEREPNAQATRERERQLGVAPTARQESSEARTENQLFRELTGTSPNAAAPPVAPTGPPMSQEGAAVNQLLRELTTPSR